LFDDLKTGNRILFETGRADIKGASSFDLLNKLASAANQCAQFRVKIDGHTDNVGKADKNLELSQKRAQSVASYLASHGIDGERVSYKGYGATVPVATNDTDAGKKQNRRTEVKIVK
jgi:outer membrane protein OmpA-like peptidoglycan-associated protein